jgi:hypothetical protein
LVLLLAATLRLVAPLHACEASAYKCFGELWILTVIVTPSRILGILIIENATGEHEMAGTGAIAGFNVQVALRLSCHGAQAAPGGSAQSGAACRGRGRGISRGLGSGQLAQ